MTQPIVPKGQEIQEVLERITDLWTEEDRFRAEQQIREIIARQIEDEVEHIEHKTLLDYGVYAPKGTNVSVFHGLYGAANMVRGKTPVTEEQWESNLVAARRRNTRTVIRNIRGPEDHA